MFGFVRFQTTADRFADGDADRAGDGHAGPVSIGHRNSDVDGDRIRVALPITDGVAVAHLFTDTASDPNRNRDGHGFADTDADPNPGGHVQRLAELRVR